MESTLETALTTNHKSAMLSYIDEHPESFEELIQLTISDKQCYSWRAAWLLSICMEENDPRIQKHVVTMIQLLPNSKESQQRELMKIILLMEIEEDFEGILFDHCLTIWQNTKKQGSVRYYAFKMLLKITKKHPDLIQEFLSILDIQYLDSLTPGIKNSIRKRVKGLV